MYKRFLNRRIQVEAFTWPAIDAQKRACHPRWITEAPVRLSAHGTTRKSAYVSAFSADQKHCIAVTEEAVSLGDCLSVGLEH